MWLGVSLSPPVCLFVFLKLERQALAMVFGRARCSFIPTCPTRSSCWRRHGNAGNTVPPLSPPPRMDMTCFATVKKDMSSMPFFLRAVASCTECLCVCVCLIHCKETSARLRCYVVVAIPSCGLASSFCCAYHMTYVRHIGAGRVVFVCS